jgi:hypothetical protein
MERDNRLKLNVRAAHFQTGRLATIQSVKTTRGGIEHQMPKDRTVR